MRERQHRYLRALIHFFAVPTALLLGCFVVSAATLFNPDAYLLRRFLELRGPRPPPENISLVLLTDDDLRPPLALSPKYLPTLADYVKLVNRVKEGQPAQILIDRASLPQDEAEQFSAFAAANGVELYSEELHPVVPGGFLDRALPRQPPTVEENRLALVLDIGIVYRFPSYPPKLDSTAGVGRNGNPAVINFFGPPKTVPTFRFTDLLHSPAFVPQDIFAGDTVLIALTAPQFLRGQRDRLTEYPVPYAGSPMPAAEIHATMLANLADDTFFAGRGTGVSLSLLGSVGVLSAAAAALSRFPLAFVALLSMTGLTFLVAYHSVVSSLVWVTGLSLIVAMPVLTLVVFVSVAGFRFLRDYLASREMSLIDR